MIPSGHKGQHGSFYFTSVQMSFFLKWYYFVKKRTTKKTKPPTPPQKKINKKVLMFNAEIHAEKCRYAYSFIIGYIFVWCHYKTQFIQIFMEQSKHFTRGAFLVNKNARIKFQHLYFIYHTTTCKCNNSVTIRLKM